MKVKELPSKKAKSSLKKLLFDYPLHKVSYRRVAVALTIFFVPLLIVGSFLYRSQPSLTVGNPSPKTFKAPRTITLDDEEATISARALAERQVDKVFNFDPRALGRVKTNIAEFFKAVRQTQKTATAATAQAKIEMLKRGVDSQISEEVLGEVLQLSDVKLSELEAKTSEIASQILGGRVTEDNLDSKRDDFRTIAEAVVFTGTGNQIVAEVGSTYLETNYQYDVEETGRLRRQAAARVEPVVISKVEGETIVREGEVVTDEGLKILEELGFLQPGVDWKALTGLALLIISLMVSVGLYFARFAREIYLDNGSLYLLALITGGVILIGRLLSPFFSPFLIPISGTAMVAAIVFSAPVAVVVLLVASLLTAIMIDQSAAFLTVMIVGGILSVFLVGRVRERSDLFRATVGVALGLGLVALAVNILGDATFYETISGAGWGILGGFFAAILTIGGLPFLESVFNITTDLRLLELANPNHPLLRELMIKAPGSYNHSVIVGNLVESAAEAVGANPILARTGAYYHDIGKIRRPLFFIENQLGGDNPHDHTKPNLSCLIITAHVRDGVELARRYRLPREVVEIIRQHHGNSLVTYFYYRAKEKIVKEDVSEEEFRYPGSKPRSREAALIMMADAVEAAARTLTKPSPTRIEQFVKKIIDGKLSDGQLDESQLTLADLEKVGKIFASVLTGIYHSRLEYPEGKIDGKLKSEATNYDNSRRKQAESPG